MDDAPSQPVVSVVIPARNEKDFIENCLRSVLDNDYPPERIELLVVDGMSDDGTREIVQKLAEEHPGIRLLDNPGRVTPCAMNIGIRQSTGEHVIITSGHSVLAKDFITQCVRVLNEHPDVGLVGGMMETVNTTYMGRVLAAALSTPVGVGSGNWRLQKKEGYVDDVSFGACRRSVFDQVGLYDEELVRNQDTDFALRLNQAGVKQYMSPAIRCRYFPRSTLRTLARQHYFDGFWLIKNILKLKRLGVPRRLVPVTFVVLWAALILGSLIWSPMAWGLGAYAGIYVLALLHGVFDSARKHGLAVAALVPVALATMHFSYGLGSVHGIWSWCIRRGRFVAKPESLRITR
jgi:glycosyltransferase involved in cell wall biosynthesis